MIHDLGYIDPHILPEPLTALRGQTRIFQLRFGKSSRASHIDFVAEQVFKDTLTLENKDQLAIPSTTTLISSVKLQISTPAPSTPQITKPHGPSVERELFHTSDETTVEKLKKPRHSDQPSPT